MCLITYYQFIFLGGLVEGNIEKLCRQLLPNCQTHCRSSSIPSHCPANISSISQSLWHPRHAPVKFPNTIGCHITLAVNHRTICWHSSARARLISNCLTDTELFYIWYFLFLYPLHVICKNSYSLYFQQIF